MTTGCWQCATANPYSSQPPPPTSTPARTSGDEPELCMLNTRVTRRGSDNSPAEWEEERTNTA